MYRVLVVEDMAVLREHMFSILHERVSSSIVVHEAKSGMEGVAAFHAFQPDMTIVDIAMSDMSGIKIAQQVWASKPSAKIFFWSQFHRESFVHDLRKIVPSGAIHGYTLKSENDDKLAHALSSVLLHDNHYVDPVVRGLRKDILTEDVVITQEDLAILQDLCMGLTDKAIAMRHYLSFLGVQSKIASLADKLLGIERLKLQDSVAFEVYNIRVRLVLEAFRRGLIGIGEIAKFDAETVGWIRSRF